MDVMLCLQSVFKASPKGEVSNLPAARDHTANTALAVRSCSVQLAGVPYVNRLWATDVLKCPSAAGHRSFAHQGPQSQAGTKGDTARTIHPPAVCSQACFVSSTLKQRGGCRPKVTSSGDSSPFLILFYSLFWFSSILFLILSKSLVTRYGRAVRHLRRQGGCKKELEIWSAAYSSPMSEGPLRRNRRSWIRWTFEVSWIFHLDFRLGIPGQSHWENETREYERCLCCFRSIFFPR